MDTIKIFNHGAFDTIKNELVNLLKVVKCNGIIYRHNKYIREILYKQFKNVRNIEVSK
ncbi:hypothetical protein VAC_DPP10_033 [Vaccinia virus]|uniref:Uncharacterized protein n=1 Tax=Vaccinia virus TaxID=10245 RepID=H2DSS6_VACCV|nr:hypothetical protein VAC_DPP10_033 [Vaccinia virus]